MLDGKSEGATPSDNYESPRIVDVGSLSELTLKFNKIGGRADAASHIIPGLVGSIVSH